MAILAECDICGNQHRVKDGLAGQSIRCKDCGVSFVIVDGPSISPETYTEENGRLRLRESPTENLLWPRLVVALVTVLVMTVLGMTVWALVALIRPVPRPVPAGVGSASACWRCERLSQSAMSTLKQESVDSR